ncbi:MAG: Holliday junction resolvase RuvX, partial [Burkholderiaceae bacterium]|nr:Holliday junction resolvase RuvX [Burkholderiaceae bacterium]
AKRVLGLDVGDKRIGVALSDATGMLASPLTIIERAEEAREIEAILTIAAGDTTNWEFTPSSNRRHLFVKPRLEGLATSMSVITEKRNFQFVLRSAADGEVWHQRVSWRLPQTLFLDGPAPDTGAGPIPVAVAGGGIRPEELRFVYTVSGDAPFRPVTVFDNGKTTWLRMPAGLTELPVVLGIDETGAHVLVNYLAKGDYLLVQQVMDEYVLKLGRREVRIHAHRKPRAWHDFLTGGAP